MNTTNENASAAVAHKPTKEGVVHAVCHTMPDEQGRQQFTAYWRNESYHTGHPDRAQVFFAKLDEHTARWQQQGAEVWVFGPEGGLPAKAKGAR